MNEPQIVAIPGDKGFVAAVFVGDREMPDRVWACVYNVRLASNRSWLGCWSREGVKASEAVRAFLVELTHKIDANSSVGPMGPWLGGTYFFSDWVTWGNGLPEPLIGIKPASSYMDPSNFIAIDDWRLPD